MVLAGVMTTSRSTRWQRTHMLSKQQPQTAAWRATGSEVSSVRPAVSHLRVDLGAVVKQQLQRGGRRGLARPLGNRQRQCSAEHLLCHLHCGWDAAAELRNLIRAWAHHCGGGAAAARAGHLRAPSGGPARARPAK